MLATILVFGYVYVNRNRVTDHLPPFAQHWMGKATVDDRLAQYGQAARARLAPYFAAAGVRYPPAKVDLLALKDSDRLEVYAANANGAMKPITVYAILAASGRAGPKLIEGDGQVPEGIYPIASLNPNSLFHLSLRIGYPNTFDAKQAAADGRKELGGDIMIHGSAGSAGCLAMGDQVAEDLFVLAADTGKRNLRVTISPIDFRTTTTLPADGHYPAWTPQLYALIKNQLDLLPVAKKPIPIQVDPSGARPAIRRT